MRIGSKSLGLARNHTHTQSVDAQLNRDTSDVLHWPTTHSSVRLCMPLFTLKKENLELNRKKNVFTSLSMIKEADIIQATEGNAHSREKTPTSEFVFRAH